MAIQIDTAFRGLSAPASYVVIAPGSVALFKDKMSFQVLYRAAPDSGSYQTSSHSCAYSLEGENPYKQAYEHLKTLPEFESCIDC